MPVEIFHGSRIHGDEEREMGAEKDTYEEIRDTFGERYAKALDHMEMVDSIIEKARRSGYNMDFEKALELLYRMPIDIGWSMCPSCGLPDDMRLDMLSKVTPGPDQLELPVGARLMRKRGKIELFFFKGYQAGLVWWKTRPHRTRF